MRSATLSRTPGRPAIQASLKTAIIMGAIGCVGIIGSVGLYVWQSGEAAGLEQRIALKEQEAATGEKTANQLEKVRQEAAAISSKLRYLESSVTPSLYIPSLLRQVDQLARSMNLEVTSIKHNLERTPTAPPPEADKEAKEKFRPLPYDRDHIEMEVRGSYWTIARFVYRLTTFPKILAVETVSQQPAETRQGASPILVARLRMTGFVFKDDAPSEGKAGADGPKVGSARELRAAENQVINQTMAEKKR